MPPTKPCGIPFHTSNLPSMRAATARPA
jgi:hypothetical protein